MRWRELGWAKSHAPRFRGFGYRLCAVNYTAPMAFPSIVGAAVAVAGLVAAQQPFSWQVQPFDSAPVALGAFGAGSYDTVRQRAVFLGGSPANATAEWDGSSWSSFGPAACGVRDRAPMGFHVPSQQTIVFGGWRYPVMLGDTWAWDGATWTSVAASGPDGRASAGMFYDDLRQTVVLVAGTRNNGSSTWLPSLDRNDTWEWNGTVWSQLSPAAAPTAGPCTVAYDSGRNRAVLQPQFGNSIWEWDSANANWVEVVPTQTPPFGRLAFDPTRSRVLLQRHDDTWEWDGADWTLLTDSGTQPYTSVLFDEINQRMLLVNNRVWLSQNVAAQHPATATPYGSGCGTPELELRALSRPLLGQAAVALVTPLRVAVQGLPTSWVSVGWNQASNFAWPTPDCVWLHTSEVVGLPAQTSGIWWIDVPYDTVLLDVDLYLQGLALAPGENAGGLVLSNGVHWRIGDN